jgi:hypothetical protein
MGATINRTARFDAVPNHVALTVSASWRHRVNRTFEAIERQGFAGLRDSKGLVVVRATHSPWQQRHSLFRGSFVCVDFMGQSPDAQAS